jgi:Mg2+-importing ATPase
VNPVTHFWSYSPDQLLALLNSKEDGLSDREALCRLHGQEQNKITYHPWKKNLLILLRQYKSPLVLLLVFAASLSLLLGEYSDSSIVILVLLLTGVFGFIQERNAGKAVEKLQELVRNTALVRRSGTEKEVFIEEVVQGDIVLLNAGDIIPGDAFILAANDLHINQAILTGESYPVEKFAGPGKAEDSILKVTNAVFKGTNVINGTANILVVNTAQHTEIGKISSILQKSTHETAFEKGIRQFGYLLMRITLVFTILILILNIFLEKRVVDSLLFTLALAVGLTPELLPAIVSVTLSAGARRLADKKVIVKKLSAIQNLGEMEILCCDKTGTLTEGIVRVHSTVDITGASNQKVKEFAYQNAFFESGFSNPIDEAITSLEKIDIADCIKTDEVPYDFIRKRLSVVIKDKSGHLMITKGALQNILQSCTWAELPGGKIGKIEEVREKIGKLFLEFSSEGFRTIGICYKDVSNDPVINKEDESDMTFLGLVTFTDPPKEGVIDSITQLQLSGIKLKLITGDNHLVAKHIAGQIGLSINEIMTGADLHLLTEEGIQRKVISTDVFAEMDPGQKVQILRALQKNGHTVGYLGDGINDAIALKIADVGISVSTAVDVAKEAAVIVLTEKNIDVILSGVMEGRRTFMNTLKYIFVTTSANFGNMFSMALASLFLPFLPLLPVQILLNNFLSDIPALAIASDKVDPELMAKPLRWDMKYIRRFMITFGIQSSLFDFLTFGLLLYIFHVSPGEFRTGWFMESLLTEIVILLIIRTQRPLYKSKPSTYLLAASLLTFCVSIILPYLPFSKLFGLIPLPLPLLVAIIGIAAVYALGTELTKKYFLKIW